MLRIQPRRRLIPVRRQVYELPCPPQPALYLWLAKIRQELGLIQPN